MMMKVVIKLIYNYNNNTFSKRKIARCILEDSRLRHLLHFQSEAEKQTKSNDHEKRSSCKTSK